MGKSNKLTMVKKRENLSKAGKTRRKGERDEKLTLEKGKQQTDDGKIKG
jgi:hypothetical protein